MRRTCLILRPESDRMGALQSGWLISAPGYSQSHGVVLKKFLSIAR